MTTTIVCLLAVLLDTWVGEPRRAHPLGAFHRFSAAVTAWVRRRLGDGPKAGLAAWGLSVGPWVVLGGVLAGFDAIDLLIAVLLLYMALGAAGILEQAQLVADALARGEHTAAAEATAWMAGQELADADPETIAETAVYGILANANTAIFLPLFWYVVGGIPGLILARLTDALATAWPEDAPDTAVFGRGVRRLATLLGWLPARLGALTYALVGDGRRAFRAWRHTASNGFLVVVGAAALGLRPPLADSEGLAPAAPDLPRAAHLLQHALWFWLITIIALDLLIF